MVVILKIRFQSYTVSLQKRLLGIILKMLKRLWGAEQSYAFFFLLDELQKIQWKIWMLNVNKFPKLI